MPFPPPLPVLYFDIETVMGRGVGRKRHLPRKVFFVPFIFCFGYRFMRAATSQPRGKAREERGLIPDRAWL